MTGLQDTVPETLENGRALFRNAPYPVIFRAALQIGLSPSTLRRWIDGEAELRPPQGQFVSRWLRKGGRPVWLTPNDYKRLRAMFKGAAYGAVRYAARKMGVSEHLIRDCLRKNVNPHWDAVHAIKAWLGSVDRDALRPAPKSVMQEIKRTFKNASIEVRRATASAIGVGEPELHRWVCGTSKPSIANAQLIKAWWDHGGFSFRTGNLSELPARAGSGNVIEQLRALLADAPQGALRVAAADSGIDANSLGTYVSGARRATSETLREIGVWLATVDVNSYRGFSQAEWKSFRAKFGKLSRPEKRHLSRKLGVSDNSLDGWYRGTANPKLVAIRAMRAWLQEGGPRASSRSNRRTRDGGLRYPPLPCQLALQRL